MVWILPFPSVGVARLLISAAAPTGCLVRARSPEVLARRQNKADQPRNGFGFEERTSFAIELRVWLYFFISRCPSSQVLNWLQFTFVVIPDVIRPSGEALYLLNVEAAVRDYTPVALPSLITVHIYSAAHIK